MKRSKQIYLIITLVFVSLLRLSAQEKEVVITIDTLSNSMYMLTGQGGNIGIYVGEESVFMIDDQFERLSPIIKTTISKLSDKPIAFLFNTHMHGDHTGGNGSFNSKQTTIIAHDNVRTSLKTMLAEKPELGEAILPEITFSDDVTLYDGDETIMAFHVHNAHTNGDAMIYFMKNNVIHMGDTYFSTGYPYIDLNNGGSVDGYIDAHKKALMVIDDNTKIIPGHGRPSNKKELENYVAMLEDIRTAISEAKKQNRTLEEVEKDGSLTEKYDAVFGNGFIGPDKIRATFYTSLK